MEFTKYKLNELGTFFSGGTPSTKNSEYWDGNIPWITPRDLSGYKCKYISSGERSITELGLQKSSAILIPKRSVLMSSRAPIGYVVINENEVTTNQGFKSINCNEDKCLNEYMYYWIKNNVDYIISKSNGSIFKEISGTSFKELIVKVPSLINQTKIVNILSKIDKKIELNNEINNNLYELGDTLYKNYYSQYDGNLPYGYTYKKLNEVSTNLDAKRKPMSSRERERHKGIYPYYGATSIIDYVDNYIFDDTYLLMGEDGTVKTDSGNPVLQYIWGKNWINNHAHVLKGTNISTEHLLFALRKVNIESLITGAVQPKINQENMNKIQVVIGPSEINEEFENLIKPIMEKSKIIVEENKTLEQLRDTLLPKLMNGEIDLENIEI